MQITSLEIRRNTYGYATTLLGRTVTPDQVVGQVKLASADGAELVLPLTEAQMQAALNAIADTSAIEAQLLGGQVRASMFQLRPALVHVPAEAPRGWEAVEADPNPRAAPYGAHLARPASPDHGELELEDERAADQASATAQAAPRFEVGQRWRTRDAGEVVILEIAPPEHEAAYPITGADGDATGTQRSWTLAGRFFTDQDSVFDLVELLGEEELPAFAVGQKWRTRSGQVAEIIDTAADEAGKYPIAARLDDGSEPQYTTRGRYFAHSATDDRDLVELVDEVAPCAG